MASSLSSRQQQVCTTPDLIQIHSSTPFSSQQTLTYLPSAHGHEDGAVALRVVDVGVVFGHNRLKLAFRLRLFKHGFVLRDSIRDPGLVPFRRQLETEESMSG